MQQVKGNQTQHIEPTHSYIETNHQTVPQQKEQNHPAKQTQQIVTAIQKVDPSKQQQIKDESITRPINYNPTTNQATIKQQTKSNQGVIPQQNQEVTPQLIQHEKKNTENKVQQKKTHQQSITKQPIHEKEQTKTKQIIAIKKQEEKQPIHQKEQSKAKETSIKKEEEKQPIHEKEQQKIKETSNVKKQEEKQLINEKEQSKAKETSIKKEEEKKPIQQKEEQKAKETSSIKKQEEKQQTKAKQTSTAKKQEEKQPINEKEQPKVKETSSIKKQEQKTTISNLQFCQQFFTAYKPTEHKQITSKIIFALNSQIPSKLPITHSILTIYLQSQQKQHSFQQFTTWLLKEQTTSIKTLIQYYKISPQAIAFTSLQHKLKEIVTLIDDRKSTLNIHIGMGQPKGKTILKYGLNLSPERESKFQLSIDIKTKKKQQLRTTIEQDLKKIYKSNEYHLLKLCKIDFIETEKTLRITIHSKAFEEEVLHELISTINSKNKNNDKNVFKLEGEITIKNSVRSDDSQLVNKKFVKWIAEGAATRLHIEANPHIVQYFTSLLSEIFPVFKAVHSGQINLKLKSAQSVDKLFDKLGISQICEQTPSLSEFLSEMDIQYLQMFPFVGDIIRRSIYFASNTPGEKIGIEVEGHIATLQLNLTISSETCKQFGTIVSKSLIQHFS